MKKRVITILLTAVMAVSMVSCGKSEDTQADAGKGSTMEVSSQAEQEETKEKKEESGEEDLPNWKGVWKTWGYGVYNFDEGTTLADVGIDICYPSLKPPSAGWAYQKDPACVLVAGAGYKEGNYNKVDMLEDTLETAKEWMIRDDNVREINNKYADADFIAETEELVTINGFSCCKYTGKFTYTYNPLKLDGEPTEERESDFVAYAVDTRQTLKEVEGIYPVLIIVLDDSQGNPSMEPLPEGTIEAYARKMVESIRTGDNVSIVEGEYIY